MTPSFDTILAQATVAYSTLKTENPLDPRPEEEPISNPKVVLTPLGQPILTTQNTIVDALYAIALEEMQEDAVPDIQDNAFNNGNPIPAPDGGLFRAGKQWTYVWTRDTSYAVDLALASLKPQASLNSLNFKTSELKTGGKIQIVQDTGTGGSYPISSDRVVWALAANKLLHFLAGDTRTTFLDSAFETIKNTIEHDRQVIFDPQDGLYSGEQSFLDWREQTYPDWVKDDVIHVGMSKCLSTNLLHFNLLNVGADLAQAKGEGELSNTYRDYANALKKSIQDHLYLDDLNLYSTYITTFLDKTAAHRLDLLGSVLAILLEVTTSEKAAEIIANYPVLPNGPSVIWPQQQNIPIYHNRAIWPFVTAYWIKAARKVGNAEAVNRGIKSLMQGVVRYRSNMENFEVVSQKTWIEEGPTSGPRMDSQAQLWSVAGYLSMVNDILFGLETNLGGIRFLPYITYEVRNTLFKGTSWISLIQFPYKGKRINVRINFPVVSQQMEGVYTVSSILLNGISISQDFIQVEALSDFNTIDIQLSESSSNTSSPLTVVSDTNEWRNIFAPKTPKITDIYLEAGKIKLMIDPVEDLANGIALNIYRDEKLVKEGLSGSEISWIDNDTNESSPSYCYTLESYFNDRHLAIRNYSQKSSPFCYWGPNDNRVQAFDVSHPNFKSSRGSVSYDYGYPYYKGWGKPADTLTFSDFKPPQTGTYLLQVSAANGSGPTNTGITCAVKCIKVLDLSQSIVGQGYLIMPQTGDWNYSNLKDSSFVRVKLDKNQTYTVVIGGEDEYAFNMSNLKHFDNYNATGGGNASFNDVNITSLKFLALTS
ncbi:MAG: hypothetical protein F6K16_31960 [Symploca sp. SIO2B6]|nr:hypothetical protein [Symploca sp. SIO2B6]